MPYPEPAFPVLTDRRAGLLRLVVREYVDTAQPVGSKSIREKYHLTASPATIRNDMQALEAAGLLTHPYTSAGRMPSDRGYRVYVEALMGEPGLGEDEKRTIRHQFSQTAPELDAWAELAAVLLARSLGLVSVVAPPRFHDLRVRRLELIALKDMLALLVVVLREARVLKQLVSLSQSTTQAELDVVAQQLNSVAVDQPLERVRAETPETGVAGTVGRALVHLLEEAVIRETTPHIEGMSGVLEQPEFQQHQDAYLRVFSLLDQRALDRVIPMQGLTQAGVSVVIGRENQTAEMRECTVIVAPYGLGPEVTGFVGLVGPTRLPYGRSIASVRYLSALMQEMMERIYG